MAQIEWTRFQKHRLDYYPDHFVCFGCRKMFKRRTSPQELKRYATVAEYHAEFRPPCPECGQPMLNMGIGFKPPKSSDLKRWAKLEELARAGKRFWYVPSWL